MNREAKKHLFDVQEACKLIQQFAAGKTLQDFQSDLLLKSAIERQFLIIGEALQKLHKANPEVAERIPEYRNIINFRHILVHGYDRVEDEVTWGIVESKLQHLMLKVESLLNEPDA